MTAVLTRPFRRRRDDPEAGPPEEIPPLSPRLQLARGVLIVLFIVSASLLLELLVVSSIQQRSSQQGLFNRYRAELGLGTAPTGPLDRDGKEIPIGAPVAYLEIPSLGLRQVVVQGTTPAAMFDAPGHRRDTVLPGQKGTSIILGRRASFGGPFARIHTLQPGAAITVTTGQGTFEYEVIDVRREGEPAPPPLASGKGRLLLATADGRAFFPDGVLRVDADLASDPVTTPSPLVSSRGLPANETIMASDTTTMWALVLWLQALILASVGAVWAWKRWGRARTWVVFLPLLLLIGLQVADEVARLLPNML